MGYAIGDAKLKVTKALPNGAATIYTDGLAIGAGDVVAPFEVKISAPALATGVLGDAATMKYSVEMDDNAAFSSPTALRTDLIVQTGAGGAGAAAASAVIRLPVDVEPYIRVKVVNSAAGNASTSSVTMELLF